MGPGERQVWGRGWGYPGVVSTMQAEIGGDVANSGSLLGDFAPQGSFDSLQISLSPLRRLLTSSGGAKDAAKHPLMRRMAPRTKHYPATLVVPKRSPIGGIGAALGEGHWGRWQGRSGRDSLGLR